MVDRRGTSTIFMIVAEYKAIREVGDLNGIDPYPIQGRKFTTDAGSRVEVRFEEITKGNYSVYHIPTSIKHAIHVGYAVEGEDSQFKKSNYRELIRILKTVIKITLRFLESHPEVDGIVVFPVNKDSSKRLGESDYQKHLLYKALMVKHISKLGNNWTEKDIHVFGEKSLKAFLLYRKNIL